MNNVAKHETHYNELFVKSSSTIDRNNCNSQQSQENWAHCIEGKFRKLWFLYFIRTDVHIANRLDYFYTNKIRQISFDAKYF
jgi:hypothetical protein